MMLLTNFPIAFLMLWPQLHVWPKHEKSEGKIGQQHHQDVVGQG
jgi:hypothetical protein